jgi:tetratricopeptide (TPR) repeat protein
MIKIFLISSLIILFVSCKGKTVSKRVNEIGDENRGIVINEERPGDFSEEYQKAADLISENKVQEAIKVYKQLLNKESEKDLAYAGLGACYNLSHNYLLAIDHYKKALAIDSNCISALIGMGSAYYSLHNYDTTIIYYDKARSKNSKIAEAYWGLAMVYDRIGSRKKAKENAKQFIELAPGSIYRKQIESILIK